MRLNPAFSTDPYLVRRFHIVRQNCWHMARDAWLDLTGTDVGDRTPERVTREALLGQFASDVPTFQRLDGPEDPCLVLMLKRGAVPHVGVLVRGKVLQMAEHGPSYLPVTRATEGYDAVEFYR